MRSPTTIMACLILGLCTARAAVAADRAPEWLVALAREPVDSLAARADAVVLLNELRVEVMPDGRQVWMQRYAARVLRPAGREAAVGLDFYQAGNPAGEQTGWLLRPSGNVTRYHGSAVSDRPLESAINESGRVRMVDATPDAGPGSVFGFESVRERRTIFLQYEWQFDEERPVLSSRFVLRVPGGWKVNPRTFGPATVTTHHEGETWTWERSNVAALEDEPWAVPNGCRATRVQIDTAPPLRGMVPGLLEVSSWEDVSRWLAGLAATSATPTPALTAAAQQAVRGAPTLLDSVRAIAAHAQGTRYVALELGLERGGGYRPRPAAEVLAGSYGDCKDKANLMKTMLAALGIPSMLAVVQVGNAGSLDPDWPSPMQFDHCILAVPALRLEACPARVVDPRWGPLVFFDPTDPVTSFGDLPSSEQGQHALLVDPAGSSLVRMPDLKPEHSTDQRQVRLEVAEDGGVRGTFSTYLTGQSAARERQYVRESGTADRRKAYGQWLAGSSGGIELTQAEQKDGGPQGYGFSLGFLVPGYAQRAGDALMMVRPIVAGRMTEPAVLPHSRQADIQLYPRVVRETVLVVPPAGWKADEIPDGRKIEQPFARYDLSCKETPEGVVCTRTLEVRVRRLPAGRYEDVRAFFTEARRAEETPIVFARP